MAAEKFGIGFDLGTTFSSCAFSQNGKAEVVTNVDGNKTTSSVVAFMPKERIVGVQAFAQAKSTPENVIYDSKRLIGRLYDEHTVKEDMLKWPFVVKKGPGGRPVIVCKTGDTKIEVSPEEVGAAILRELKLSAESFLKSEIKECCITCPASYNDAQRQATIDASRIAGLKCLRLINEPTAAAIAYGVNKGEQGSILIYDFGGGTFDATILSIEEEVYEVRATCGDPHLGGKDLDHIVMDYIMEKFNLKRTDNRVDIHNNDHHVAKNKLAKEVEDAKIALSSLQEKQLFIGSFVKDSQAGKRVDVHLKVKLTRKLLEKLAKPLVEKTLKITLDLLKNNSIKISEVKKVVPVGGFTKMPFVKEQLKIAFGEKLSLGVNADEAVALGAAMMAEVLSGESPVRKGLPSLLLDVTPLALGIELKNGIMSKIIQMNTPYPTIMEEKYSTTRDDQTAVKVQVYQGNREFVKDNKKLGFFKLDGIPKMKKGQADIAVSFALCEDGVLSITAVEKSTGINKKLIISKDKIGGLTEEELKKMVQDAEMFADEDRKKKEILVEKEKLERAITENEDQVTGNERVSIFLKETSEWLEDDCEKRAEDFVEKRKKLEGLLIL